MDSHEDFAKASERSSLRRRCEVLAKASERSSFTKEMRRPYEGFAKAKRRSGQRHRQM